MDEVFGTELCVLIGHYLEKSYPEIYEKFIESCESKDGAKWYKIS